eukprot:scaffold38136_cov69-Cyclotella_meneghiniana.AAC.8
MMTCLASTRQTPDNISYIVDPLLCVMIISQETQHHQHNNQLRVEQQCASMRCRVFMVDGGRGIVMCSSSNNPPSRWNDNNQLSTNSTIHYNGHTDPNIDLDG